MSRRFPAFRFVIGIVICLCSFVAAQSEKTQLETNSAASSEKPLESSTQSPRFHPTVRQSADSGSSLSLSHASLSTVQVRNLFVLAKVWGFLKYHHPSVTAGHVPWDDELLKMIPRVLQANNLNNSNRLIHDWVASIQELEEYSCTKLEREGRFNDATRWISDDDLLGDALGGTLCSVLHYGKVETQHYVGTIPDIGNPSFANEYAYPSAQFPNRELQLLALFRMWNIVEYWSPERARIGTEWDNVLLNSISAVATAADFPSYVRALFLVFAQLHDGHANLWGAIDYRPPVGPCGLPLKILFIAGVPVVAGVPNGYPGSGFVIGDQIEKIDGKNVSQLVEQWLPLYAASNVGAQQRDVGRFMTRGQCGEAQIGVLRDGKHVVIVATRVPRQQNDYMTGTDDLPGPTFRLLSKDVAYLKLSTVNASEIPEYLEKAADTLGLIVDIRNYPSDFVVFSLGNLLVDRETAFVRFSAPDLQHPGDFKSIGPLSLTPLAPHYKGKVVILVDELTMSQSEYTCMALQSSKRAITVGAPTAGADGNISSFILPGNLKAFMTGLGVYYQDGKQTQEVGVTINFPVKRTLEGVKSGTDEILEEGLRQILGEKFSVDEIHRMARPN